MTNPMGTPRDGAELGGLGDELGLGDAAVPGGDERPDGQPEGDAGDDVVEHDRRDHLVDPAVGLEDTDEPAHEGPDADADDHAEQGAAEPEPAAHVGDPGAEDGAGDELALAADVEQADAQREDDGEPGEHEGRGLLQGAGQGAVGDQGLAQQGLVRERRG